MLLRQRRNRGCMSSEFKARTWKRRFLGLCWLGFRNSYLPCVKHALRMFSWTEEDKARTPLSSDGLDHGDADSPSTSREPVNKAQGVTVAVEQGKFSQTCSASYEGDIDLLLRKAEVSCCCSVKLRSSLFSCHF